VSHSSNYMWLYGVQRHGVGGHPGESCFWRDVAVSPVPVQEQLRGWWCGSLLLVVVRTST
jgi:hypothetical protein